MRNPIFPAYLLLILLVSSANAASRTWTGAGSDNRFSTTGNWAEGIAPAAGDDIVFPANAGQYSPFLDVFPDVTFNSMTFQGGNYSFVGYCRILGITVNGGIQDLGTSMWILNGPITVWQDAQLQGTFFGRDSRITLDGPGNTAVTIGGGSGGTINMVGSGTAVITLATSAIDSLTVNNGQVYLYGPSSASFGTVIVNGGRVQRPIYMTATTLKVTGENSEYVGGGAYAGAGAGHMEFSSGATLNAMSCHAFFQTDTAPLLTGSVLAPLDSCVGFPDVYLISNRSSEPVVGSFSNYPEGSPFTIQGRLYRITYHGGDGNDVQVLAVPAVPFDLNGDRKSDIAVFRQSDGIWYVRNEAGFDAVQWGLAGDKIVPGDYDGDNRVDEAVYRPSEGYWYVRPSSGIGTLTIPFGLASDIPAPADYDADAQTDLAVFRPSTGEWWISQSTGSQNGLINVPFGLDGDLPVPADYDGDGKADVSVFRPSSGTWYIRGSRAGVFGMQWGQVGDIVVPADFDGDGKTDIAVFRPSQGVWYQYLSGSETPTAIFWGSEGDVPVPGDYDGDGKADVAIYRPSDGNWWINGSTAGISVQHFGLPNDDPVPAAYVR